MNIVAVSQFSFKCKNNDITYKATKNNNGNWVVSWVDYDGALQRVTYIESEFGGVLNIWDAVEVSD